MKIVTCFHEYQIIEFIISIIDFRCKNYSCYTRGIMFVEKSTRTSRSFIIYSVYSQIIITECIYFYILCQSFKIKFYQGAIVSFKIFRVEITLSAVVTNNRDIPYQYVIDRKLIDCCSGRLAWQFYSLYNETYIGGNGKYCFWVELEIDWILTFRGILLYFSR